MSLEQLPQDVHVIIFAALAKHKQGSTSIGWCRLLSSSLYLPATIACLNSATFWVLALGELYRLVG